MGFGRRSLSKRWQAGLVGGILGFAALFVFVPLLYDPIVAAFVLGLAVLVVYFVRPASIPSTLVVGLVLFIVAISVDRAGNAVGILILSAVPAAFGGSLASYLLDSSTLEGAVSGAYAGAVIPAPAGMGLVLLLSGGINGWILVLVISFVILVHVTVISGALGGAVWTWYSNRDGDTKSNQVTDMW